MGTRAVLLFLLLGSGAGSSSAARARAAEEVALAAVATPARKQTLLARHAMDKEALAKLPKILNSAAGLGVALVTAFLEDDPDIEYAMENLHLQGWQLVKLTIPDELENSNDMGAAKKAWDVVFENLPDLVQRIQIAYESGNMQGGTEVLLETMDAALGAAAQAVTAQARISLADKDLKTQMERMMDDFDVRAIKLEVIKDVIAGFQSFHKGKYIHAAKDFVQGVGGAATRFTKEMGLLDGSSSLVQIGGELAEKKWDAARISAMLTTGVGLITTFLSAGMEEPPDFQYAITSFKIQGWKLAKLAVPPEAVKSEKMRKAKKAWSRVFAEAPELAESAHEAYENNDVDKTVQLILGAVDRGLRAAAEIEDEQAAKFTAVADLIQGVSGSVVKFGHEVGWLKQAATPP